MKKALVEMPHNQGQCWVIMLESLEDFYKYSKTFQLKAEEFICKIIKSSLPVDRWDHVWDESEEGSLFSAAINKCKIVGGSPLVEYSLLLDKKIKAILFSMIEGHTILINKVGGWMPLSDDAQVIKTEEYIQEREFTHHIPDNTRYINLENDPVLEQHTKDYLSLRDENYSYILNLRRYSHEELVNVFTEFKEKGGHTVYVYTTGSDVQQMYDYSESAIAAGIRNFIFEFNSEVTDQIHHFLDYIESQATVLSFQ